jgi:hypothetical protein
MIKSEKIPANNEELKAKYKTLLESDIDTAQAIIDAIPGKIAPDIKTIEGTPGAPGTVKHSPLASIVNPQILARLDTQVPAN